jgi:Tfp pilus assembly protein PilF
VKKGIAAAQKGDREYARELLTQAAGLDPSSEDAWMWLASISDYPEELLAFLNKVLAINPSNERAVEWHAATRSLLAKTFVQRGIAAHNDGSHDLAGSCFDQALDHDANYAVAWMWKARAAGSDDEKVQYLERVLEIDPDNEEANAAIAPFREPSRLGERRSSRRGRSRRPALCRGVAFSIRERPSPSSAGRTAPCPLRPPWPPRW